MNFLVPTAFAFAAAIPVVILFYLLKRKRVVRLVSSSLLWQKFLAETQASSPFQKLRHNWLLLLQILLLILAVLALARPYFAAQEKGGALYVVILDGSASMQATDVKPTRFEQAREQALDLVAGMKPRDQMVVLQAGAHTEVKQSPTTDKSALRRAIGECAATDSPTRLLESLKLAQTLIQNRAPVEVHLFSDGAFPEVSDFQIEDLPAIYHRIGETAENVGIVAMDVRGHPEDQSRKAIFASVANFGAAVRETAVNLRFDDRHLETRAVSIEPGETANLVFTAGQNVEGVFTVEIDADDELRMDNRASLTSLLPRPAKVLLVTGGNRFLQQALRSIPTVELTLADGLTDEAAEFDIVILDSVVPGVWPNRNVLVFNAAPPGWFESVGRVENPAIVDWSATHGLMRFVTFDNVAISEALAVPLPGWAAPVVESQQTPLILVGELDQRSIIWVGFDPLNSTWPLRVSFPIFVANSIDWLNPAAANASRLAVPAGSPLRLALSDAPEAVTVDTPDGDSRRIELGESREVVFGGTTKAGVYRLHAGTNSMTFCVNLLDSNESNIEPRETIDFGRYGSVAASQLRTADTEIWRWFLAAGLAVLLFEWWFYHRRTA